MMIFVVEVTSDTGHGLRVATLGFSPDNRDDKREEVRDFPHCLKPE
jgi:hypothetical protein